MSSAIKKPPPPSNLARRPSANPPNSPASHSRSPSRSSTQRPSNTASPGRPNRGLGASTVSARTTTQKSRLDTEETGAAAWSETADEDAKAERAGLIEDLRDRLQKAEADAEHYRRQAGVTQSRLEEALGEQAKLEERLHEVEERTKALEDEKREVVRQRRELEAAYETQRLTALEERERVLSREEEMQNSIRRLKELLAQKDIRSGPEEERRLSRTPSFRSNTSSGIGDNHFAPPSSLQRSTSENSSKLLLQKDKVIEALRLELAEAQIKLIEVENMGGGRVQELEKILLETRMANARLMEDNESFQLLLSEKTLNGDFSKGEFMRASSAPDERVPSRSGPSASLADELQSATSDNNNEAQRQLEAEVGSLKDQNKALTLYINSIIERLLNHKEFESILDKTPNIMAGIVPRSNVDKELPPPPEKGSIASSLLQRAKSAAKGTNRPKPSPVSHTQVQTSPELHTANEDPASAPSIPLRRSQSTRATGPGLHHRRTSSELAGAAVVVNNMYRGPPPVPTSGQMSPGLVSPRNSFFGQLPTGAVGNPSTAHTTRTASSAGVVPGSIAEEINPSSTPDSQEDFDQVDDKIGIDTPSPPRSANFGLERAGSVMAGNKVRPLRLVQESAEAQADQAARNKANRGSWMAGWFTRGKSEDDGVPKRSFSGEAPPRNAYS